MSNERRTSAALAAFDLVEEGILVVAVDRDAGFPVVDANESALRMVDREREDVVGRPLAELQPARVVAGFARRVDEALHTGVAQRAQVIDEGPAGRVTLDVSLAPIPEPEGRPAHVVVVLRDVTALLRITDTLYEIEEVTSTGTWSWDVVGDTVRWSSRLYDLFGLRRDEMAPSFAGYLERVHPDDRDALEAAIDATFETGEPFELRHRVVTPAGEVRLLDCTGRRVARLDGTPVRMTGTAQLVRDDPTTTTT